MPRNYDSSQPGVPYIRVTDLSLTYDQAQNTLAGYTDQRAIMTTDGKIEHLLGQRRGTLMITPAMWSQAVPRVVDPTTGQTNGTITWGEIHLAVLSGLRSDQRAWDASQEAAEPGPGTAPQQP